MSVQIFPCANIVIGVLLFVLGFVFHWIGQLYSVLNWEHATRLGLQEKDLPPEYKDYERGFAVTDSLIAWLYGIAAVGLVIDAPWGYKLAWIPGAILFYHAVSYWCWTANQISAGRPMQSRVMRIGWFLANSIIGLLTIAVAWNHT